MGNVLKMRISRHGGKPVFKLYLKDAATAAALTAKVGQPLEQRESTSTDEAFTGKPVVVYKVETVADLADFATKLKAVDEDGGTVATIAAALAGPAVPEPAHDI